MRGLQKRKEKKRKVAECRENRSEGEIFEKVFSWGAAPTRRNVRAEKTKKKTTTTTTRKKSETRRGEKLRKPRSRTRLLVPVVCVSCVNVVGVAIIRAVPMHRRDDSGGSGCGSGSSSSRSRRRALDHLLAYTEPRDPAKRASAGTTTAAPGHSLFVFAVSLSHSLFLSLSRSSLGANLSDRPTRRS